MSFKDKLGLRLIKIGIGLYFRTDTKQEREEFDRKVERFVKELNGDLLEAHTIQAGGHGYIDSKVNHVSRYWVGSSIVNVFRHSERIRLDTPLSAWALDALDETIKETKCKPKCEVYRIK